MSTLRNGLPPLPPRMLARPVDDRGYPVPWFVCYVDGRPDFRIIDGRKVPLAINNSLCWLCGQKLGTYKTFVLGPMCAINRTISEPPSHKDCAEFAVQACPFLILPRAKRREANIPDGVTEPPGLAILRNPGATLLWTTKTFRIYQAYAGKEGMLIRVGDPENLSWWCEGRPATRAEVMHSIDTGLPHLEKMAAEDGEEAIRELQAAVQRIRPLLPLAAA